MYRDMIDTWIARYYAQGVDLTDVLTIQQLLEDNLRETVPVNLIHTSIKVVTSIKASS